MTDENDTGDWTSRKTLAIACALFVVAMFFCPLRAFAQEGGSGTSGNPPQTVKVGYYYDGDYYYKSADGSYGGYDVEYYYEIAKYTGWHYEYVDYGSFEDAYAALENGQIDLLPSLFYTQERADALLLSERDMGSVYVTVVVPPSNDVIGYDDPEALQGKKIGTLSDTVDEDEFVNWAAREGIAVDVVSTPSTESLLQALDEGELDAVAISYLGSGSDYRIVDEFSPMKMYFGMPKDRTALMAQLNEALVQIAIETPDFTSELYGRYYLANQKQSPVFTEAEKAYIASSDTLTVALPENNPPFSYIGSNGQLTGAVVEYFQRISDLSGLRFAFIIKPTVDGTAKAVQDGEADIAGAVVYDAVRASADKVLLTNSYSNMAATEISLKGANNIKTLALPSYLAPLYSRSDSAGDGITLRYFDTASACMDAMNARTVDGAVLNTYTANYYINSGKAGAYNVTALNGFTYRIAAGLPDTANRNLYSVLNRCIRYSNTTTMNELIVKHSQTETPSLPNTISRIPSLWIAIFSGTLLLLVAILIYMLVSLKRHQKAEATVTAQRAEVELKEKELALLEKNAKDRNQFFSNVSHDMRTPLNAIIGFSELAESESDLTKLREYNAKINSSGILLLSLINDTLTLSKASSNKLELHLEPVRTKDLFESIIVPVGKAAEEKGITFTADYATTLNRTILADKLSLQKIFLNLLSNAIKYTPAGGHVELLAYNVPPDADDPDSLLIVHDDGIGISQDFLPRIFDAFSQEGRRGYESVGTGLGLSIVKQLVDLMDGSIEVESEVGKGTTFTVRLHFQEAAMEDSPEASPRGRALPDTALGSHKVLLVEDNDLNAEIATKLLERRGIETIRASNGSEGIDAFEASTPGSLDAILMDIRMPVMGGLDASRAIRELDRPDAKTVPIIAMTADVYNDDIERCLAAGMNAHVAKPVDPDDLFRVLEDTCED